MDKQIRKMIERVAVSHINGLLGDVPHTTATSSHVMEKEGNVTLFVVIAGWHQSLHAATTEHRIDLPVLPDEQGVRKFVEEALASMIANQKQRADCAARISIESPLKITGRYKYDPDYDIPIGHMLVEENALNLLLGNRVNYLVVDSLRTVVRAVVEHKGDDDWRVANEEEDQAIAPNPFTDEYDWRVISTPEGPELSFPVDLDGTFLEVADTPCYDHGRLLLPGETIPDTMAIALVGRSAGDLVALAEGIEDARILEVENRRGYLTAVLKRGPLIRLREHPALIDLMT